MGSKERIQRLKDSTRANILEVSLAIAKEEGWDALSMRKIADRIEYTAPVIYEYFASKEAIVRELGRRGFLQLTNEISQAKSRHELPENQLQEMWQAYWKFAFAEQSLYRVMFGVGAKCCELMHNMPESEGTVSLFKTVLREMLGEVPRPEEEINTIYFTLWSLFHGLVSINMVQNQIPDNLNWQVMEKAINGITRPVQT